MDRHILSNEQADAVVQWLSPYVVIPTHYLCKGVSSILATLRSADEWVMDQSSRTLLEEGQLVLNREEIKGRNRDCFYFGSNMVDLSS